MQQSGMLAIWSDIAADIETDYLHWLTREHATERVSTPGFAGMRVFRALLVDVRRYLIVYDLCSPAALDSADYLHKLNNPTPWSQRIMPLLKNFARGGGPAIARAGVGAGAYAGAMRLDHDLADAASLVEVLSGIDRICGACVMQTDTLRSGVRTREKALRKNDGSFASLLFFHGLDEAAIKSGIQRLPAAYRVELTVYRQIFALDRRALDCA